MKLEPTIAKVLENDKKFLEKTEIPIVTVSGTSREDLKKFYGLPDDDIIPDIVFSRAHFSMTIAVLVSAWGNMIEPQDARALNPKANKIGRAWAVDPTNYVSPDQWRSILITEWVGKKLARNSVLKRFKDFIDKFGRNKLPILTSITPPLLYLTENVTEPILSFHIAAGNILAEHDKKVFQVITDPHVREDYLNNAHRTTVTFCVFDERTKTEVMEKAALKGIEIHPERVIVTGPPVDPRVVEAKNHSPVWSKGTLKLCITTGGLGTNKEEIRRTLTALLPELRKHPSPYKLLVYAGTQKDIRDMVHELAHQFRVKIDPYNDQNADLRVLYHPQLLDANELLIRFGFPWAHGFISKPSGDMAYDAVASGSFLLTLQEWGEWEHNIREIFEQKDISRPAVVDQIVTQLETLKDAADGKAWITQAMENARNIDRLFLEGSANILKAVKASH